MTITMKNLNRIASARPQSLLQTIVSRKTELSLLFTLAPVALLLSACGGGGGGGYYGGGGDQNNNQPILAVGMQRQFTGTTTRTVVYATPTSTNVNNTLAYSFTESQNVLQAPLSAPGYFDINSVYAYTVTQDPGVGAVPISQTVDDYRNLYFSGNTQATSDFGQNSTVISNDETSNLLGDGPYTQTTVTTATYPTPRPGLVFPLLAGETNSIPQSSVENITFTDVNAANAPPPSGNFFGYTRSRTENNDGSFSFQQTGVTGFNETFAESANGSGAYTNTGPSTTTTTTISVPALASSIYTIPVNRTITSSTPGNVNYSAADWYPGGGLVPAPLVLSSQIVVGQVSALPSQCNGALMQPNTFEVDTTTTNLNTVNAVYSVTTTQGFNSNGVSVCSLTQETSSSYDVLTGALFSTTTTQTTTILAALNY